jgi:hypothetical protein
MADPTAAGLSSMMEEADHEKRNRLVKECLRSPGKRGILDESLSGSVAEDVYNFSLARVLLEPQIMRGGQLPRPVESAVGPAIEARLTEEKETIVLKNSYRESIEDEVQTTVRTRLSFVDIKGSVRSPSTFEVSNHAKFRSMGLNGSAYSLVDRARKRMAWALGTDETKITIRCILWAAANIGSSRFVARKSKVADSVGLELARLQEVVSSSAVLANPKDAVDYFLNGVLGVPPGEGDFSLSPFASIKILGNYHPVYAHFDIPEGQILILPIGRPLGTLGIDKAATVVPADKPERFVIGWTCGERIGVVLANAPWITTIFVGHAGIRKVASVLWNRLWRRTESAVERPDAR